jgi:cytochrome c2
MKNAWIIGLFALVSAPRLMAEPQDGAQLFENRCAGCHVPAGGGQGPSLTGVVGRKAGTAANFGYSAAMKALNIVWTSETLDTFLADPGKMAPGTAMPVHISNAAQRTAITNYLVTGR